MQLKNSRYVYYSESSQCEILHAAKVKEITGNETLTGRHLHSHQESFKPVAVHIVTSNYDFEIHATDHGTWRRIKRVPMKIKFCKENVDEFDSKNPHERIAD
jgi:putative DNA primase/helicase